MIHFLQSLDKRFRDSVLPPTGSTDNIEFLPSTYFDRNTDKAHAVIHIGTESYTTGLDSACTICIIGNAYISPANTATTSGSNSTIVRRVIPYLYNNQNIVLLAGSSDDDPCYVLSISNYQAILHAYNNVPSARAAFHLTDSAFNDDLSNAIPISYAGDNTLYLQFGTTTFKLVQNVTPRQFSIYTPSGTTYRVNTIYRQLTSIPSDDFILDQIEELQEISQSLTESVHGLQEATERLSEEISQVSTFFITR